ncbi:MAG: hypothetical protein HPY53_00810 [Brevinematales bacterium]|nr:hypothetical protein [Brevinematales bacterium]
MIKYYYKETRFYGHEDLEIIEMKIGGFNISISFPKELRSLMEAKHPGIPLGGSYSVIKHPPHTSKGQYHLHTYDGNNLIFSMNLDGTPHDGSHGIKINNKVADAILRQFPKFTIPKNRYLEMQIDVSSDDGLIALMEHVIE